MLNDLWYRLRALFRRRAVETELDEELRFHFERQVEKYIESGLTPPEARRRARLEFGGLDQVKEDCREARGINFVDTLFQDIRFAIRLLAKTPAMTTVALLSLALGIGANTAIFSLIDTVMLRMLPVEDPEQLAQVQRSAAWYSHPVSSFTNPIWEQFRDHQDVFSGAFAWSDEKFNLADGGEARSIPGIYASGEYFTTLGIRPAAGRLLTAADDHRGCNGVAVLGYGFWQQHYAGAESAIGQLLRLDGHSFQVIGVASASFFGMNVGDQFDVALPICAEAVMRGKDSFLEHRSAWWLKIAGRLKPGSSVELAAARLKVQAPGIYSSAVPLDWPGPDQERFLKLTLVTNSADTGLSRLRAEYKRPLLVLMAVVGLVLLIACANIASLMLARSAARRREIAVCRSLGASRARLVRQVLTESLVFSTAGALLGVLFARWGVGLLVHLVSTTEDKVFLDFTMDGRVLGFTMGITALTALLFGILPALGATRVALTAAMKGDPMETGRSWSRLFSGRWLIAVQVALSLMLLIGTGLFIRSFHNLLTLDAGFDKNNVLLAYVNIHNAGLPVPSRPAFYREVLDRMKAAPGANSVSQSWFTPVQGKEWNGYISVGGRKPEASEDPLVYFNWATPGYFATLRTPLLGGRDFDDRDTSTAPPVAVVNQALAHQYFPNEEPVGKYFHLDQSRMVSRAPIQIVGVVKNTKYVSLREDSLPIAYFPITQVVNLAESTAFEIRSPLPTASVVSSVRDSIGSVNKAVSVQFIPLARQVDDSLAQERLLALLSSFFGFLALLLTAIGLYGVMAYMVTGRTHEIGIRMALGAPRRLILELVLRDLAILLVVGLAAGILGALWMTRLAQQLLFNLAANDAGTTALAVAVFIAAALGASYIPARRATRVDPMIALRYE